MTTTRDEFDATVDDLIATTRDAAVAPYRDQLLADEHTIGELGDQITALQAQLAAATAPKPRVLYGANIGGWKSLGETATAAHARIKAGFGGKLPAIRVWSMPSPGLPTPTYVDDTCRSYVIELPASMNDMAIVHAAGVRPVRREPVRRRHARVPGGVRVRVQPRLRGAVVHPPGPGRHGRVSAHRRGCQGTDGGVMSADPWQVPDWRTYFPRGVLDPTGPRGEAIETSTDRRLLWDIESFFAVNGTTDRQREFGSVLRRYLADTCEHHWLDYEGDDDIPAHSQCLWCNDVRWSVRVVTGFEPRPETVAKAHCATCTCGRRAPVQLSRRGGTKHGITYGPHGDGTISWAEHEQAWAVYGAQYSGQSAERIAERGGFSYSELVEFLGHEPTTWRSS